MTVPSPQPASLDSSLIFNMNGELPDVYKLDLEKAEEVKIKRQHLLPCCAKSCLTLCNQMDLACQGPLSMGLSKQEYWSRLPFPSPGDLPNPRIEPRVLCPWGYPSKNTEVDCHILLQGIFLTQGSNPGSSVHGVIQARILKWIAISFSRGSS